MPSVLFLINNQSNESNLLYDIVSKFYSAVRLQFSQIGSLNPIAIITDDFQVAKNLKDQYSIFLLINQFNKINFTSQSGADRRSLLLFFNSLGGILVSDQRISQEINKIYKIKTLLISQATAKNIEKKISDAVLNKRKIKAKPTLEIKNIEYLRNKSNLESIGRRHKITRSRKIGSIKVLNSNLDYEVFDTPSWFFNKEDVDVSIIVPMFRSKAVIKRQIYDWDIADDGLKKEIIYVDDCCPVQSYEHVVSSWEKHRPDLKGKPVGKLIRSFVNRGYGPACNLGAKYASGKYLIFLNADVYVKPNWVKPLYDLAESDPKIGIIGNLQIQENSINRHLIDSAGSEFSWTGGHFDHIGRGIYQGKRIKQAIQVAEMPNDLKKPAEREMVTGCCFLIPKKVFLEIGGYDEAYKIGYWEDSEMNMVVRQKGYKVFFHPDSQVYHIGGHSRSGSHPHALNNRNYFKSKWINTGILDDLVSAKRNDRPPMKDLKSIIPEEIIGCIIACNEEEFLEASIESIAPFVDRFVISVGGNQYAYQSGMCGKNGYPTDGTLDVARKLSQKYDIKIIEPPNRLWQGKTEQRQAYADLMKPGQWSFMLDGDEVYKESQLWQIALLMKRYEVLRLNYYLFWNNMETLGTGSWENYPQERIVKWRAGYKFAAPNHLEVSNSSGRPVSEKITTYQGKDKMFYHYAYVRPLEKIKQKIDYYKYQLSQEWGDKRGVLENYIKDVFLKWRSDPRSVSATHPRGGGSFCKFAGIHPYNITKLIEEGKFNFDG